MTYAGDITSQEAWDRLTSDPRAVLLDVRTPPEWSYVGLPDITSLGRQPALVPWLLFPSNEQNPNFVAEVESIIPDKEAPLLIVCRSGVRSKAAAIILTAVGFKTCHNIDHGFEGDKDAAGHRGTVNGWKVAGLPWVQG